MRMRQKQALEKSTATPQDHSWRVEATTNDGRRWLNGVRLGTKEEAEVYISSHVQFDLEQEGYVTARVCRCDH